MSALWLEQHLEEFVKPYLGYIPNVENNDWTLDHFPPKKLEGLLKTWEVAKEKAAKRPILLPGRDVYLFEVVTRILEDYEVVEFDPILSSPVSKSGKIKKDYSKYFAIDSGYNGSVPKALKCADFGLVSGAKKLINPELVSCGSLESCPKYWNRGDMKNGKPFQTLSEPKFAFHTAGMLTRYVGEWLIKFKGVK